MRSLHTRTPLLHSFPLSRRLGVPVYLKLEALQPTGSFKLRGVGRLCVEAAERGVNHFVSSSGGNAGLAAAHAAEVLGKRATVFVPTSTGELTQQRLRSLGAEVIVIGAEWDDAHAEAVAFAKRHEALLVHPFDHPSLWAGHSTLVDELTEDLDSPPGCVVLSVGGGGLLTGVVHGLRRAGWNHVPVIAMETIGADSLACALDAGALVELPAITSAAKTLGARKVAAEAFSVARAHDVRSVRVSDAQASAAQHAFADDHRILVELSCGAALAAVYTPVVEVAFADSVVVVVCGGAGVTLDSLSNSAGA
ncbi:MAG: hypothetical protein AUK47_25720 [Deltaproteobacteria bacterium CG2_30_63_29]|nr:MAG: hypothetical protein AUK47_25720 [Deltaproteobacteria bacterium CG2_30_63_29]PJB49365.1 MAG: serine dehydratase [Deltaproteobacteria bacterium CG_4_9_14_3_um_filter_63_12]